MVIPAHELQTLSVEQLMSKYTIQDVEETRAAMESMSAMAEPHRVAEGITPVDTSQDLFSMHTLETAGRNLGPNLMNFARGIPEIPGAMHQVYKDVTTLSRPPGADYPAARERMVGMGEELIKPFTSAENLQRFVAESPADAVMTFAPAIGPISKSARLPGMVQKAMAVGAPGRAAGMAVEAGGQLAGAGRDFLYGVGQIMTGQPSPGALRLATRGGLKGERAVVQAGRRGEIPKTREGTALAGKFNRLRSDTTRKLPDASTPPLHPEEIVRAGDKLEDTTMIQVIRDMISRTEDAADSDLLRVAEEVGLNNTPARGVESLMVGIDRELRAFGTGMRQVDVDMKNPTRPSKILDIDEQPAIPGQVRGTKLEFEATQPSTSLSGQQVLQELVTLVDQSFYSGGQLKNLTLGEVNNLRRALGGIVSKGDDSVFAAVSRIQDKINDFIDGQVGDPKWKEARRQFGLDMDEFKEMKQAFSVENLGGVKKNTAILRSLANAMSPASPRRAALLKTMEEASGIPIQSLVGGMSMAEFIPKGLMGRQQFLSAGAGAAAGSLISPWLFLSMPLTMPRVMSKFLVGFGVGMRPAAAAGQVAQRLMRIPLARELAEQGLNIGAIIRRLQEQGIINEEGDVVDAAAAPSRFSDWATQQQGKLEFGGAQ